jgi:hypothetical protein
MLPLGGRGKIEPRALCEQFELPKQGLGSDPSRDGVRLPEWHARFGAGRADRDGRFGLTPAAIRR